MFSFAPDIVCFFQSLFGFPFSPGEGFLQNVQGSLETAPIKDTKCWATPVGRLELSITSESHHWRETGSKQAFLLGGLNNSVAWRLFLRVIQCLQAEPPSPSWEAGLWVLRKQGGQFRALPMLPLSQWPVSGQPPSAVVFPSPKSL